MNKVNIDAQLPPVRVVAARLCFWATISPKGKTLGEARKPLAQA
jgi:hypothetical protein